MKLARALEEKLLDVRLRDKLMAEGKLTKAEVDEYLQKVPDDQKNALEVKIDENGRSARH